MPHSLTVRSASCPIRLISLRGALTARWTVAKRSTNKRANVNSRICFFTVAVACAAVAGCTGGKSTVTGSVTLDGRPLAKGAITFIKQGGELTREGAVITDGAFHALLPVGSYKLELNAQKVTGKRKQK